MWPQQRLAMLAILAVVGAGCATGEFDSGPDTPSGPDTASTSSEAPPQQPADTGRAAGDISDSAADTWSSNRWPRPDGTSTGDEPDTRGDIARGTGDTRETGTNGNYDASDADASSPNNGKTVRNLRSKLSLSPGQSTTREHTVRDVVVTGIHKDGPSVGFFVQDRTGPPEKSGLWVFTQNRNNSVPMPTINRGSVLRLRGTVTNYTSNGSSATDGLLQMEQLSAMAVTNRGAALPTPVSVSASAVAANGPKSETYEGVLVELRGVQLDSAPNQFKDAKLRQGLVIGPALYDYTADFSLQSGQTLSSVVGVLNFSYGKVEISPRESGDITF